MGRPGRSDIADTVTVDADLKFRPTGVKRPGALNNTPVTGEAVAEYDGKRQVVTISHAVLLTPQSSTEANGILGVNQGDPLTDLKVDMTVRDLGEFDQLLQTLGPFRRTWKERPDGGGAGGAGSMAASVFHRDGVGAGGGPGLEGPPPGDRALEVKLDNYLDTQIDSLVADAAFSYDSRGWAVASSTIKRGSAVLERDCRDGCGRAEGCRHAKALPDYEWDTKARAVQANDRSWRTRAWKMCCRWRVSSRRYPGDRDDDGERDEMRGTLEDPDGWRGKIALEQWHGVWGDV